MLEIGCGWGAFAERLIRHYGSSVFGITLSTEQLAYAQTRLAGDVERGRADLRLLDYRDVPGTFDRIASIEMIEAVGERYWQNYFGKIRDCLAGGGVALLQAITIDERRFAAYRKCPDFIQRYIFPGGVLPTFSIIEQEAARAGLKLVHHAIDLRQLLRAPRESRRPSCAPRRRLSRSASTSGSGDPGILSRLLRVGSAPAQSTSALQAGGLNYSAARLPPNSAAG